MSVMAVAMVAFGLPLITMSAASAHNAAATADCTGIKVATSVYSTGPTIKNTLEIQIDGNRVYYNSSFGAAITKTQSVPQDGVAHDWKVIVKNGDSAGTHYDYTFHGTVGPCAAVPVNPTIHEPTCTTPGHHIVGTFDLPNNDDINGIVYSKSGNVVTATVTTETGKFVLPSNSPWTLVRNSNAKKATYTVSYTNPAGYPECVVTLPTPVPPVASEPSCSADGDLVVGPTSHMTTKVDGNVVNQVTHVGKGDHVLTYIADTGYTFAGGTTKTFPVSVPSRLTGDQCATEVQPVTPTVTSTCTGAGTGTSSFTLPPAKDGISYSADGLWVTATADSDHKFGTLPTGWSKIDNHIAKYLVHYPASYPECVIDIPVPTPPTATEPTCALDGSLTVPVTEHVITTVGETVIEAQTVFGPGQYTISYAPAPGYTFGDQVVEPTVVTVLEKTGNCPASVVSPTVTQSVCTGPGTHSDPVVTPGDVEGDHVSYKYDAATHVVTASADTGYALANLPVGWTMQENGTATYVVTFTDPGPCTVIVSPPTTTSPTVQVQAPHAHHPAVLPNTGGPTPWLALGGLVLLLGGGALLTRERLSRRES
ncbi:MAG TPA: LPXTG cell wall anchor domain-containing protein [Marmoricola sp.]|nr:LPXTG cell wall anchor domain-containing protein [Marmoricola sp.]